MSSARVIDALFERTVDIVQSLPPTATEGDVTTKRPGMFDMLGRAKWDAWENQHGYTEQDAKQLYVENLLKILRRFGDRPQAISLMAELEAYSGDIAEQVMDGTLAETASLHSSSVDRSTRMEDEVQSSIADELDPLPAQRTPHPQQVSSENTASGSHSHETVTVSDMPRAFPQQAPRRVPRRAQNVEKTPPAPPAPHRHRSARYGARYMPPTSSVHSAAQGSDRGSRSFASAQPSLYREQSVAGTSISRSVRSGPMGRYAGSVGRSSAGHAPPPAVPRVPIRGPGGEQPELDQTLRAIQSSLVTLTARLEKAEDKMQAKPEHKDATVIAWRGTMRAATHTLYDLGTLLGIVGPRPQELAHAPSYDAWRAQGDGAPNPNRDRPHSLARLLLRAPFTFSTAVVSLLFRLMLDMTSLVLLATALMALVRRVSGRGDPLILLRLLGQASARLQFFQVAANRRVALRALLASAVVGGAVLETRGQMHR
ncbi:hypothetical protein MVES_002026 [Malassezia vespertilionis]|uniref:ACB domain-containing protein n=1 Tax=Malassezia vespertilionis TaxID=2020962 RepID=A0A2N1JCB8_9BASI|nr:hypothetical protein MVES_002026 [Malassezia vespertilionis]